MYRYENRHCRREMFFPFIKSQKKVLAVVCTYFFN